MLIIYLGRPVNIIDEDSKMKTYQILKIAGSVVGGLAGVILVIDLFQAILTHPVLDSLVVLGALSYFAGVWLSKQKKK